MGLSEAHVSRVKIGIGGERGTECVARRSLVDAPGTNPGFSEHGGHFRIVHELTRLRSLLDRIRVAAPVDGQANR